jgi:Tfp pilus assembly protein PilF
MDNDRTTLAHEILRRACQFQEQGDLDTAIHLCRQSISLQPTAEAHSFLAGTLRVQGLLEEAITESRRAIELDASRGVPYNDIGLCLIDLGRPNEAIPWLEQATRAARYEAFHLPWFNLGRIYLEQQLFGLARDCFQHALDIDPDFQPACDALDRVRRLIQ